MVDKSINRVKEFRRQDMLEKIERVNKNSVRAVVFRYDRRLPDVLTILKKNWKTMTSDDTRLVNVFPEPPMVSSTRGKNLREAICPAKLPPLRLP